VKGWWGMACDVTLVTPRIFLLLLTSKTRFQRDSDHVVMALRSRIRQIHNQLATRSIHIVFPFPFVGG